MPKHKPIKFESTLQPSLKRYISKVIKSPQAKSIINATLGLIALGGILTFGAVFPALLGEIGRIRRRKRKEAYEEYQKFWHNFYQLKKQRALDFVKEENGCLVYKLNNKGETKIKKFIFEELKIEKPKKWDSKWRLVIFDIPESKKRERTALRHKLIELGFYQFQKSVWIYPFDCLEEIEFIKDVLNIKPFVKTLLVTELDDGRILYYFKNLIKKTIINN